MKKKTMDAVFILVLVICSGVLTNSQRVLPEAGTGGQHTVELLVVMDKMAFDSWYEKMPGTEDRYNKTILRVADFLGSVMVGVNDLYESLDKYGLYLDVRLKKLHILKHDLWEDQDLKAGSRNQILTDRALKIFYVWSWRARSTLGTFDHALLLTGYDLVDPKAANKTTQGVAYKGVMCRYGSVSVVENNFTHQVIDTMAHELGHSLGCDHDEDTSCKNSQGHVMSTRTEINSTNRWSFSPCSAEAMKQYIGELNRMNANCLVKTTTVPTPGIELGQLMGPDQQCRMLYGADAFFCREFYPTPEAYEKLCSSMWCSASPSDTLCQNHIASDGFVCGDNQVCSRGNCSALESSQSVRVSENPACPQGDQPGLVYDNLTCSELVDSQPWLCYGQFLSTKCCLACSTVRQNVTGCEYGDKAGWCSGSEMKYPFDCYLNDQTCCQTCLQYRREDQPECVYGDHSQECQTKLSVPIGCYENEALCCETCAKAKSTTNPECKYGDRSQECQTKLSVPIGCYENEALCCETCANVKSTTNPDCLYGDKSTWCQDKLEVPNGCYLNQDLCCATCGALANETRTTRLQEAESQNETDSFVDNKSLNWCLYGDRYPGWCQREAPNACYNATQRDWCCQSCAKVEKADQPGCQYGDHHKDCDDLVYPYACYIQENARMCCSICGLYRNSSRTDCPYGDREAWCYKLNEKYSNEQWCHLDLENGHCCGTCLYDETDVPVFGSRVKKLGLPNPK